MLLQRERTSSPFKRDLTRPSETAAAVTQGAPRELRSLRYPSHVDVKLLCRAGSTPLVNCRHACPGHYTHQRVLLTQSSEILNGPHKLLSQPEGECQFN